MKTKQVFNVQIEVDVTPVESCECEALREALRATQSEVVRLQNSEDRNRTSDYFKEAYYKTILKEFKDNLTGRVNPKVLDAAYTSASITVRKKWKSGGKAAHNED
jgi:hypothetical protein